MLQNSHLSLGSVINFWMIKVMTMAEVILSNIDDMKKVMKEISHKSFCLFRVAIFREMISNPWNLSMVSTMMTAPSR